MVPIMKTTNAKSVQSDFTYPAGDPPPVVPPEIIITPKIAKHTKLLLSSKDPERIQAALSWILPCLEQKNNSL